MAVGPYHYSEAEHDLASAYRAEDTEYRAFLVARAQVHATLALAAASAMGVDKTGTKDVWDDWQAAFTGGTS